MNRLQPCLELRERLIGGIEDRRTWSVHHLDPPFMAPTLHHKVLVQIESGTCIAGRKVQAQEVVTKKWLRRIRGAVGMGLTWALAWFGAGVILLFVVGFGAADVPFPLGFGALGFIAGATLSGVLGIAEGRRRFDQMSLPRFAGWGAVGGLVLSGIFVLAAGLAGEFLVLAPVFALSSAASAAGSLALARRAEE